MSEELSKDLRCVEMRNGVRIWLEKDRAENLASLLSSKDAPQFVAYEGRMLNRADLVGVFMPSDIQEQTRRKNGQWQDKKGEWRDKGEKVCKCGNSVPYGKVCGYC